MADVNIVKHNDTERLEGIVSGGGCVILRAAARRMDDYSTVAQWARGEWEMEGR